MMFTIYIALATTIDTVIIYMLYIRIYVYAYMICIMMSQENHMDAAI